MAVANRDTYRTFCSDHAGVLPVFYHDWYLDAVCGHDKWDTALVKKDNQVVGIWPWFKKKRFGFTYLAMPLFTKFMGPWIFPGAGDHRQRLRWTQQLSEQLPKVDCIKADCHYQFANWLPLYWQGFRQTTRYSYQLDLSRELDDLYKGLNRNMRRNIKNASKELEVRPFDDPELFYRINSLSFRRQGLATPYSLADFQRHDAALRQKEARHMYLAQDSGGNVHSVAYLIWDQQSVYYHLSGDDPAHRNSGSGMLLIWEGIRYAKEDLGLATFDFEGSMMKAVGAIRRQFGAKPLPYSRIWRYDSRLYAMLDQIRNS